MAYRRSRRRRISFRRRGRAGRRVMRIGWRM